MKDPEVTGDVYFTLKQSLGLLTDLWESILGQEEIQRNLGFDKKDWKENQLKIIQYLKTHNIKNNLTDRYEKVKELQFQEQVKNIQLNQESRFSFSPNESNETTIKGETRVIGLKNNSSFLVLGGRSRNRYWLIENKSIISSGKLRKKVNYDDWHATPNTKVIYSLKENAYFIVFNHCLYRKDIDRAAPRLIMRPRYAGKRFIKYSESVNRLFVNRGDGINDYQGYRISVINPLTKKIELTLPRYNQYYEHYPIVDFLILEQTPLKILILSSVGVLKLVDITKKSKESDGEIIHQTKFREFDPEGPEAIMRICSKNKFLLLNGCDGRYRLPYLYSIYELQEDSITFKHTLSLGNESCYHSPFFVGYFDSSPNRLIFFVQKFSSRRRRGGVESSLEVLYYNTDSGRLQILGNGLVTDGDVYESKVVRGKAGVDGGVYLVS